MGHLEAAAAAAGLSSLVASSLFEALVPVNAQLRRSVLMSYVLTPLSMLLSG